LAIGALALSIIIVMIAMMLVIVKRNKMRMGERKEDFMRN
jgi:hypothetical protein